MKITEDDISIDDRGCKIFRYNGIRFACTLKEYDEINGIGQAIWNVSWIGVLYDEIYSCQTKLIVKGEISVGSILEEILKSKVIKKIGFDIRHGDDKH